MRDYLFGNYLCGQRVKRKLSQRELADQLGVSDKAVSKWENGRSKPKSATLYKLAAIFGISVEELISCGRKVGLSPTMQNDIKSFALPDDQITDNGGLKERGMNVCFIPEKSIPGYDYICSWSLQLKIAKRLGITGEGCSEQRDVLTDELLFGKTNYYHGYPVDIREGLIFVLDDGWDVPFGTKNLRGEPNVYGRCDPDPEKFADYGETPDERLKTLSDKFKSLGYAGLGLWISPQMSGESSESVPTLEEAREYWIERAKWCAHAGIRYFKIDWGAHALKIGYRKMLTDILKEYAPDIIVEHAFCQPPYSQMGDIERRRADTAKLIPISDAFRLYDVFEPFMTSSMLMRAHEALSSVDRSVEVNTDGILNGEWCGAICAVLGFALGAMHNPDDDTSELACLRWHRVAPPFSIYDGDYLHSEEILIDDCFFERNPASWIKAKGKRFSESAPAIMARNCELPTVTAVAIKPFVIASHNPKSGAWSIASLPRTVDPNRNFVAPADVEFKVGAHAEPVGIFGSFNSLTLDYSEPIGDKRVFAQDMLADAAFDITEKCVIDDTKVKLDGCELRLIGSNEHSLKDAAMPSLVIGIVEPEKKIEYDY